MPLQIRRGTNAERELQTFIAGELVWITDEQQLVVGDGQTQGGITVSGGIGTTDVQAITAGMFTAGTHSNISFTYDQTNGVINASVSVSGGIGTTDVQAITAGMFTAGTHSNISFTYDQTNGVINASVSASSVDLSQIDGDIIPNQNDLYDIGSPEFQFSTVYTQSIQLGDAAIILDDGVIDLPLGTTVSGNEILSEGGIYNISIIGEDSTILVDTINNSINISVIQSAFTTNEDIGSQNRVLSIGTNENPNTLFINCAANAFLTARGTTTPGEQPYLLMQTSLGTVENPAPVQTGSNIGGILMQAYADDRYRIACGIRSEVEAVSNSVVKATLKLTVVNETSGPIDASLNSSGTFTTPLAFKATPSMSAPANPENGMIFYNASIHKFQGYANGVWVNLH